MTNATTADILAAGELMPKCELMVWFHHAAWACESTSLEYAGDRQYGATWYAAVRAWAEAAGVPWPSVKVVPMWCSVDRDGDLWDFNASREHVTVCGGMAVVQCEVVIRNETEATP